MIVLMTGRIRNTLQIKERFSFINSARIHANNIIQTSFFKKRCFPARYSRTDAARKAANHPQAKGASSINMERVLSSYTEDRVMPTM